MKRTRGFTLLEVIIFIVVVAVGLVGILSVMNTSVRSSADPMVRKQTLAIAESMLEEILQKDLAKPVGSAALGFAAGGVRNQYDCVSDYNGYNTAGGIENTAGIVLPNLGAYNIAPPVVVAVAGGADNANLVAVGALRVTVSVTGPGGTITLVGYRASP